MYRHAPPDYDCPFCAVVGDERPPRTIQADVVWRDGTTTAWINGRWWARNPENALVVARSARGESLRGGSRARRSSSTRARRIPLGMKAAYPCDGISTRQHNEPEGDQEIWHYHLHVFPRWAGDDLYRSDYRLAPAEERRQYAERLRAAL